jgi:hypothetical protein
VQGKGLAALFLLACVLVGCGGGHSSETAEPSASTESVPPALAKLRHSAKRIEAEREARQRPQLAGREKSDSRGSDQTPPEVRQDRGGGATQFRIPGGSNSIPDSGHEASAAEREAAAAVLHAYFDARVAHHWDTSCFYLASSIVVSLETFAAKYGDGAVSCPQVLERLAAGASRQTLEETAMADVGSLRIGSDHAFLLYYRPGEAPYAMPMVREGGAWKVGALDAGPLE